MLDNGYPLATESNILKELIKHPNMFRKVANMVTGDTKYNKLYLIFLKTNLLILFQRCYSYHNNYNLKS
jgi:hypothetical protein